MNSQYVCSEHIELMEMDQEWIVMDTERFTITKINPMGAYILKALMDQQRFDYIIEEIHTRFGVEFNRVKAETIAFLQQLQRIGIIHEHSVQY